MKFRSQSLTALRALLDLCLYSAPQVPTSLAEIARRQGLSAAFLEQLFRKLKAAGIVAPWRGMKGGYTLSRPAARVSALEVFQALGDPLASGGKLPASERAEAQVLAVALGEASAAFHERLAGLSLDDLRRRALAHPGVKGLPKAGAGFNI